MSQNKPEPDIAFESSSKGEWTQKLGSSSTPFPSITTERWIGSGASALVWGDGVSSDGLTHCAKSLI